MEVCIRRFSREDTPRLPSATNTVTLTTPVVLPDFFHRTSSSLRRPVRRNVTESRDGLRAGYMSDQVDGRDRRELLLPLDARKGSLQGKPHYCVGTSRKDTDDVQLPSRRLKPPPARCVVEWLAENLPPAPPSLRSELRRPVHGGEAREGVFWTETLERRVFFSHPNGVHIWQGHRLSFLISPSGPGSRLRRGDAWRRATSGSRPTWDEGADLSASWLPSANKENVSCRPGETGIPLLGKLRRIFFSLPIYHASGQEVRPTAGDSGNAARFAWKMKPVRPQPPSPQPPPSKGVCRQVCHGHPPRRFARHVATRDIFHPDAVSPPWSSRLGIWKDENPRVMDTVSPRSRDCETGCVPSDGPGWC